MEDREIHGMLRVAQCGDDVVQEFAWICLQRYRRECSIILGWHDESPDVQQRDELLDRARGRLRERLRGLVVWAERTARM